jgi:hypothetical protein
MLPSRSSPRPGGRFPQDPYYPSSRSRSTSRPRHGDIARIAQEQALRRGGPVYRRASPSPARRTPSPHPPKPHRQHSREHHAHSRSRPIPMPDYRHNLKSGNSSRGRHHQPEYIGTRRSEDSVSSVSSSPDSLFDRRGAGSGYASSRTSLEDEAEPPKRGRRLPDDRTIRERRMDQRYAESHDDTITPSTPEDGNSVWSRVATAASTLTVSVSKAWAVNVTNNPGEDTPPGEESRLFRAMKAYHLDKARDPSDLPPWLFSEQDRRPLGQLRLASRQENTDGTGSVQASPLSPPRSRGLRDIYDAAGVTSPTSPRNFGDVPTSKAASHLKALRDAKRNVLNPNATSPREEKPIIEHDESQHRRRVQRRMGMPVGPGVKHGRF